MYIRGLNLHVRVGRVLMLIALHGLLKPYLALILVLFKHIVSGFFNSNYFAAEILMVKSEYT